jgi:transcriptional regulator with XRE-family HTH domain
VTLLSVDCFLGIFTIGEEDMAVEGFAERLRQLRQEAGLTIQALADKAGLHREGVAQLERNRRQPTWETVIALADALDISTEEFRVEAKTTPAKRGKSKK